MRQRLPSPLLITENVWPHDPPNQTKPHREQAVGYRVMSKIARQSETVRMTSFFNWRGFNLSHDWKIYSMKINFRLHTQSNNSKIAHSVRTWINWNSTRRSFKKTTKGLYWVLKPLFVTLFNVTVTLLQCCVAQFNNLQQTVLGFFHQTLTCCLKYLHP